MIKIKNTDVLKFSKNAGQNITMADFRKMPPLYT